jgi:SsrA-binding protein
MLAARMARMARMVRGDDTKRTVATNRRARHDYHLLEELELGLVLRGTEVKSLRSGRASIGEAYGMFRGRELFLVGATIPEYSHGTAFNHAPTRERKLLGHRRELDRWGKRARERGTTVVPLELYFKGHLVKVRMALVQGKKLHDKRERTREREAARDIQRAMSRRR